MEKKKLTERLKYDFMYYKWAYLMAVPVVIYIFIFSYVPMYGILIAFKEFSPSLGVIDSPWVGLKYFKEFFNDVYFFRILSNTFLISFFDLLFGFTAPIIFALLLNEIKNAPFKKTVQTITYLPYFVSTVVICGILINFLSSEGAINKIISLVGIGPLDFLGDPKYFRAVYVGSGIWQSLGFNSIIFLSAIASIDQEQYESAVLDGASKLKQAIYITVPNIAPTIIILLILRIGSLLSVGFEKILLLYNPLTYQTADVISTYVFRQGLVNFNFSYSTAIGLFNTVINFVLLVVANTLSRKYSETSLF